MFVYCTFTLLSFIRSLDSLKEQKIVKLYYFISYKSKCHEVRSCNTLEVHLRTWAEFCSFGLGKIGDYLQRHGKYLLHRQGNRRASMVLVNQAGVSCKCIFCDLHSLPKSLKNNLNTVHLTLTNQYENHILRVKRPYPSRVLSLRIWRMWQDCGIESRLALATSWQSS